jgi:glucose-1-phosphate cytidylyltransferase
MAYRHEGFFFAMDTYCEYETLNKMWHAGRAPWKVWQ